MLISSFSQDLIYATSCGQSKPPKHILLSYGVKTLTGNVELIQMLNRLGHGVSYTQLEENDTALCLQKMAANLNQRVVLPAVIQPNVFTNLAWDNIDRLEETLTGGGTTHRVNGIAVQPKVYGPQLPSAQPPIVGKRKQRTITQEVQPLAEYIAGERVGPQPLKAATMDYGGQEQISRRKDLVWLISRLVEGENQQTPSWTGHNIKSRSHEPVMQDVVGYLPTINAPATQLSTVNEILSQSENIRKILNLPEVVVVMDQALYAKACEVAWKQKDIYANILLRMGTFHTICNLLSIIGKRFQDAGLRDLCIESGIITEGSLSAVLEGKMYNRAVRVHKCIYEALLRLIWKQFIPWVMDTHPNKLAHIHVVQSEVTVAQYNDVLNSESLLQVFQMWNEFLEYLRRDNGQMSAFWMSYIQIVGDVLLGLIRASREGNWLLHLYAVRMMIPWCFAYDKINYARYLPVYYAQMTNLPAEHPDVHQNFMEGHFSVQLSDESPFARIPVDQTTEVTVNKDTKTTGGVTRFSLKTGAMNRFYLTAEYRCGFLCQLRNMVQAKRPQFHHNEMQSPRMAKDEKDVSAVEAIIESWNNPFFGTQNITSISTAKEAPADVSCDLMNAYEIGEKEFQHFKEERLENSPPKKKFHDPMKLKKLKTFTSLTKKKAVTTQGRTMILKADRSLFGRMIISGQSRKIEVKEMLQHSLGPMPWSLATAEGYPRKTNKAALAAHLQKNVQLADRPPNNSATIIDGMSLVQKVSVGSNQTTFGSVASSLMAMVLHEGSESSRIDVVFDTYMENSIKNTERSMRGEEPGVQVVNINAPQLIKQWRKFLSQMKNKTSLIRFLVEEWQTEQYVQRIHRDGKELYVTCENKCWKISGASSVQVPELCSCQEEADTRLLLHAAHAAQNGYDSVVISSEDTDVFVLLLAFSSSIDASLFQKCGTRTRTRLVDISKVVAAVGEDVCRALVGLHSFTGCDTVSAFAGKGKLGALKILKSDVDAKQAFTELGQSWNLSEDLFRRIEKVTCAFYSSGANSSDVNDLRYSLFCAKNGEIESHQLPPCKDCLRKHTMRANYQACIWRCSLQCDPSIPDPVGFGWKMGNSTDGELGLTIDWMDGKPAPEAVLELLACRCSRSCRLPDCVCMANGLTCTDMCRLQDCENQPIQDEEEVIVGGDSGDEDEDDGY